MAQGLALTGTLKEERGGGTPQTEPHVQRPWGVSTPRVPEPEAGGAGAAVRLEGGGSGYPQALGSPFLAADVVSLGRGVCHISDMALDNRGISLFLKVLGEISNSRSSSFRLGWVMVAAACILFSSVGCSRPKSLFICLNDYKCI